MLYDLVSDLHVDSYRGKDGGGLLSVDWPRIRNPGSDLLVIAGDSHNHYRKSFVVADNAALVYGHVLILDGNHEHYSTKRPVPINLRRMIDKASRRPKVTFLDGTSHHRVAGVVFLGCNGWYDWQIMCPEISREDQYLTWKGAHPAFKPKNPNDSTGRGSNDKDLRFSLNEFYSWDEKPCDPSVFARIQADRLREQVEAFSRDPTVTDIVVTTHTAPARFCLSERPFNPEHQFFSGSYANSLMQAVIDLPGHKIRHWNYGHTHNRSDRTRHGIRFVNNSRGYASEQYDRSEWTPVQLDTAVV